MKNVIFGFYFCVRVLKYSAWKSGNVERTFTGRLASISLFYSNACLVGILLCIVVKTIFYPFTMTTKIPRRQNGQPELHI